jgi:hypothetical protein
VVIGSARVSFHPIATTIEEGPETLKVVFGGTLQAFSFGPQPPTAPGPVELVFSAEYFTKARAGEVSAVAEFAKLPAQLVLTDAGIEVQVSADETLPVQQLSEIPDQTHPVGGKLPPLSLMLQLGHGFRVLPSAEKKSTEPAPPRGRILIPPPDKPSKYLELMVSLKRDGADLAPAATNGRLDVSLLLLDFFVFQVEDEAGKTAADVDVEIEVTGGEQIIGKTDKDGRFAINGVPRGECAVLLPIGLQVKDKQQSENPQTP